MTTASSSASEAARPTLTGVRVGWVGAGVMGTSMCRHLLGRGATVTLHTRTRSKAEPLLAAGATWADSPAAAATGADFTLTMVGYPDEVRQVCLGDAGIVYAARPGSVLIDFTTTQPSLSREIFAAAAARGVAAIDAPVSGGDVGARNATLSIMVGGDEPAVARAMPIFEALGKTIVRQGGAGAGQHAKMCNQIVIAGTMIGVCEALLYAKRAGLDVETMLRSVRPGAAGCWSLENYAPRILRGDFAPGFFVEHFIKDMSIALDEARRMGLALPGLALVQQLYVALAAQGHARSGTQSLILALERLSQPG